MILGVVYICLCNGERVFAEKKKFSRAKKDLNLLGIIVRIT